MTLDLFAVYTTLFPGVLVEKTNRLYRNFKDYVTLEDLDLSIHLVKQNKIISKDSRSTQKFMHGIQLLMAKNYIDNLSEEVKKGLQEKVEQGGYPGAAPFGYINNRELHTIEVHPDTAPIVIQLFKLYSTGNYSLKTLRKAIIQENLLSGLSKYKSSVAQLHNILTNPVYIGKIRFGYPDYWKASKR
ncbi:hypothetical protein DID80_04860 [Candidatus Marinamargulisbacteria bacterium SCGC AAA071-K20]|nr:hypothetical protein DID80_04860 [Candidatus Marinamargulisbacteria bacterium SCGC AAA071-K20]